MTFEEAKDIVRREIIVDQGTDAYGDNDIYDVLWNAAYEVAAHLSFPRVVVENISTTAGNKTVTAPADALEVHTLIVNSFDADQAEFRKVVQNRFGSQGPIKYFAFDPRRGQVIHVAPLLNYTGADSIMEYTKSLAKPDPISGAANDNIWEGLFPQYHWVVPYRAGVKLFEMDEQLEDAGYWSARHNEGVMSLAARVNQADYSMLMLGAMTRGGEE